MPAFETSESVKVDFPWSTAQETKNGQNVQCRGGAMQLAVGNNAHVADISGSVHETTDLVCMPRLDSKKIGYLSRY